MDFATGATGSLVLLITFPPLRFLLQPHGQLAIGFPVERVLRMNTLQFRIVGLVFGLIHKTIKASDLRNPQLLPGLGQITGMNPGSFFAVHDHPFSV